MNRCRTLLHRPHDRGRGDSNGRVRGRNESGQDRPHHAHDRDARVRHGLHRGGDGGDDDRDGLYPRHLHPYHKSEPNLRMRLFLQN